MRAEGRHEGDVTIIPELRSETDVVVLVVAGCVLLVAGSGVVYRNVVLTVVPAAIAAVILGWWIYQRRGPAPGLTIGPDEIVHGRPNERVWVIARDATGWLRIEQNGEHGWFVIARDGDEDVGALMLGFGFNPRDVADACEAHGWPVSIGQGDPPARPIAARSRVRRRAARKPMSKPRRIVVGTVIVVSLLVCLGALGVPNWYVAIASGIVMFAAILYSEDKW